MLVLGLVKNMDFRGNRNQKSALMVSSGIRFFSIIILFSAMTNAQIAGQGLEIPRASPIASIGQTIGVCKVMIDYNRPSVRKRKIFGHLVPFDKVWRAGANEATTISFNHPLIFDGKAVPAGKYSLFIIPEKEKWIVILNKEWNQWGAYNYNEDHDIVRIEVVPQAIQHTELCTYQFTEVSKSKANLNLEWENTRISIPLHTETHEQTIDDIEKAVSVIGAYWYTYSAAAQYHFYERKEAEKALEYIDVAIALKAPNPAPWMLKSQILAEQGKYEEAIHMAEQAIEVSKKYNFWF